MVSLAALVVLPFVADYVILAVGLLGVVGGIIAKSRILVSTPAILVCLATCLLLSTVPFVFHGAVDLVPVGASLLALVAPGLGVVFVMGSRKTSPLSFHSYCLTAVILAVVAGGLDHLITGTDRIGVGNNPIHYGALSVLLGSLAIPGVVATSTNLRFVYLLGPVFALAAVLLSGSRGPFLAALMLNLLTTVLLVLWYRRDRALMAALVAAVCTGVVAIGLFGLLMPGRAMSILSALGNVASSGSGAIDEYRLAMYRAALSVLQSSPFYGIGFGQVMPFTVSANPDLIYMDTLQDLHSDPANFAASAGLPGLLAYLMLIAAPLTLWRPGQRALNMTIILLAVGQLCLGLTNTTIGILPQTMLYGAALGYCLALSISTRRGLKGCSTGIPASG